MIYCLIGHSASGKSTLEKRLESMGIPRIISYTTRPPRENEVDGVDYHFISEEKYMRMKEQGFFQESAQYRDWHYAMSLNGVNFVDQNFIFVATIDGYKELIKVIGEKFVVAIHIKVDERERMVRMVERGDDIDEIIRRINSDRIDFKDVEQICEFIVDNGEDRGLDKSLVDVYNIVRW